MPRRLALPRTKHKRGRRRPTSSRWERIERAVYLLHKRIAKLEGQHKRIGFQTTTAQGDLLTQDDEDEVFVPDEVP